MANLFNKIILEGIRDFHKIERDLSWEQATDLKNCLEFLYWNSTYHEERCEPVLTETGERLEITQEQLKTALAKIFWGNSISEPWEKEDRTRLEVLLDNINCLALPPTKEVNKLLRERTKIKILPKYTFTDKDGYSTSGYRPMEIKVLYA